MSRSSRFLDGLSFGLLGQVVTFCVGLFVTPFLLRHLGQSELGLWFVASNLLGYLSLLELGSVALLPREVAYAVGRHPSASLPAVKEVFGDAMQTALLQLPLIAVGSGVVLLLLPPGSERLMSPFLVVLAAFVILFPLRLFQALLTGLQDLRFVSLVQTSSWLAGTLASIGLVMGGARLKAVAAGWVISQAGAAFAYVLRVCLVYPGAIPRGLPSFSMARTREWLSKSLWISATQVAQFLRMGAEIVVIGKILGPAAAVPFVCTGKLVSILTNFPLAILSSAQPALSELKTGSESTRIASVTDGIARLTMIASGAVACGVLALNRGFVTWWVGREQYAGLGLTLLLLAGMLLRHFSLTVSSLLFCFNQERRLAKTALVDGAVTFLTTVLCVYQFGWYGAPIGPLVGICVVTLPANLAAMSRETQRPVSELLLHLLPWGLRFALAVAVAFAWDAFLPSSSLSTLMIAGTVMGACYAALMAPLLLQPPLGTYVQPRLASLRARIGLLRP